MMSRVGVRWSLEGAPYGSEMAHFGGSGRGVVVLMARMVLTDGFRVGQNREV